MPTQQKAPRQPSNRQLAAAIATRLDGVIGAVLLYQAMLLRGTYKKDSRDGQAVAVKGAFKAFEDAVCQALDAAAARAATAPRSKRRPG